MDECICKGNWRQIVAGSEALFGKRFRDERGEVYTFFGVVHADDDYYYGMSGKLGMRLLSCVGSITSHGFVPVMDRPRGNITDAQRIDWLERRAALVNTAGNGQPHVCADPADSCNELKHFYGLTYREAIDAAMGATDV